MSLLARYLFANNTESTGIIQTVTTQEPTYSQEGPFGFCMTGTFEISSTDVESAFISIQYPEIYNPKSQSISLWYKVDNLNSGVNVSGCTDVASIYGIRIFATGAVGLICDGGDFVLNTDDGIFTSNIWHNIIVTNDNLLFTIYLDGTQVAQSTYTNGSNWNCTTGTAIPLGNAPSSRGAKLADLRFYDHVLSKKEIKDIQKAVSCHISFDNISPTYMNRLCPDLFYPTTDWSFSHCAWNGGNVLFESGQTAMLSRVTTGYTPTGGHKYYGSVEYRIEADTMTWADNRFEWFLNDNTNARVTFFSSPTTTNWGWQKQSAIVTAAATMASGTYSIRLFTVNSTAQWRARNPLIVDLTEMFGAGNEPTKEWCDEHIDYFNGIMSDNLPDNSGGCATITAGDVFTCEDSPVGQSCAVFPDNNGSYVTIGGGSYRGNKSYISVSLNTDYLRHPPFTVSFWVKGDMSNYVICRHNGGGPGIQSGGWRLAPWGFDITDISNINIYSDREWDESKWYHVVGTVDSSQTCLYLDGVLVGTGSGGTSISYGVPAIPPIVVGTNTSTSDDGIYFIRKCCVADIKFSQTAWTAEQVQDEYQSKIVLDKSYNLYSSYLETPRKVITNLVNYKLSDETGWSGGSVSTKYTRVDKASRLLPGSTGSPEYTSSHASLAYMTNGHVYYTGLYSLQEEASTSVTQSLDIYIPVAEPSLLSGSVLPKTTYQWYKHSTISTYTQTTGLQTGRIDYNNQNVDGQVWCTDFWIVDLTAYFGSGNEPTKEWCDKYLEYSPEGLIILDEPTKFKKTESIINSKYSEVGVKGRYIKVHMSGGNGGTRNAISKISYFDRDGGEITLADASTNEHSTIISGYQRTTTDTSIYFIVDNDTVIDIGTITTINAVRLVRENDISSYFYNTIISVSENNTDYVEIYNSYNNGSYRNDDRTNTYAETANGKVFPALATKYSQTRDIIKTTSFREVI